MVGSGHSKRKGGGHAWCSGERCSGERMEKRMRGQGVGSGKQGGGAAGMVHSKQTKLRGERESRKDSGKEPSANKRVRFGATRE